MEKTVQVLHVDDEPSLTEVAVDFLEQEHARIEVLSERDVGDALRRLEKNQVDCIVSEYDLPDTDGLEFLEAVREDHPDLPFILFTGKGSEEIASEAISSGVTDYLDKNTDDQLTVLADRITDAVSRHRSERNLRKSNERIRRLYGAVTDAVLVLDEE
ncbi:hypothetical protein BRC90_12050, partial [Halobacteriales archaeon QS_4_69_34]